MTWRTGGGLLVVLGLLVVGGLFGNNEEPCAEKPVLAAGPDSVVADDCVDMIRYEGKTYYVTCIAVHPNRVGESFLDDGGDTYFEGASEIAGVPRHRAFLLDGSPCRRDMTATGSAGRLAVAMSESPSNAAVRRLERDVSAPAGQPGEIPLSATKAGFSIVEGRLGASALLENATGSDVTDIRLHVEFLDAHGEVLLTISENLPFCPARTHCWWGSSWPSEHDGDASHFASVRVRAKGTTAKRDVGRVIPFMLERVPNGSVKGFAPAKEGMAVLVASSGGQSYGVMVNVREGLERRITVPTELFPSWDAAESLRGFMYPMKVPLGS